MPRSFTVLLVPVVLTIGAVSAGAAPAGATAAPATASVKTAAPVGLRQVTSVEGIPEYLLPNGLVVLLFPDSAKPTATVNVTYLVGSRQEGYGETGMAHLLEHMLFKGTPTHSNIPQELTAHGSRPNGSTSYDRTNYFETFAATDENLEWALDLESDRMVHSKVAKADLDSEMTVVRNEFESGENSPQGVLLERVMSTAYLWHNYGKSTIGSRADIERVPIERLQAFYRKWYQPENAILVVAGKFEEQKVTRWITEKFGAIPRPTRPCSRSSRASSRLPRPSRTSSAPASRCCTAGRRRSATPSAPRSCSPNGQRWATGASCSSTATASSRSRRPTSPGWRPPT